MDESLLECAQCHKVLVEPVMLACGVTVCRLHSNNEVDILCPVCCKTESFQHNKIVQGILDGYQSKRQHLHEKRDKTLCKWNELTSDTFYGVTECYNVLRNKILLNREIIVQELDRECEELMKQVTYSMHQCVKYTESEASFF